MKVNVDQTIEISDEQRKAIARHIDGPDAKKRDATRQEMKDFLWQHGRNWDAELQDGVTVGVQADEQDQEFDLDDIL